MLDLSWGEIVLIGAVAVIFIGPKELPNALRTMGKFMGKARTMAREFQNNVDDMIREAELEEVKKKVQSVTSVTSGGLSGAIQNAIDPKGEIQKALAPPEMPAISELPPPPAPPAPAPAPAVAAPVETAAPVSAAAKAN
ncbi:MAG: twin-arginine translocase subunit TatB [Rhodospirillales bacterium]|nr:twin-arginine translocase subunit TatB [Rhodospirillales bacterium]